MKRKIFWLVFTCLFTLAWGNVFSNAAVTVSGDPNALVYIINCQVVEDIQEGNIVTRKARLEVQNSDTSTIKNVSARLIPLSNNVTVGDGVVSIGDINPGETALSQDDFTILVDISSQSTVRLAWTIEYDDLNGNHHIVKLVVTDDLSR